MIHEWYNSKSGKRADHLGCNPENIGRTKASHSQADQGIGWGAIYYMHENQVCHRDLKPENFLFMTKDLGEPHTARMQIFLFPFRTDAVDPLAAQAFQVEHVETFAAVLIKRLHSLPPSFLHPHRLCCKILSPEPCRPSWVQLPRREFCQTLNTSKRNPSRWQQRPPVLMTSVFGMGSLVPRWKWPTSDLSQCPCISSLGSENSENSKKIREFRKFKKSENSENSKTQKIQTI